MGKHFFHETTSKFGEFYRVIYCEWCGLVVWDFNKTETSLKELQLKAGDACKANLADERTPRLSKASPTEEALETK